VVVVNVHVCIIIMLATWNKNYLNKHKSDITIHVTFYNMIMSEVVLHVGQVSVLVHYVHIEGMRTYILMQVCIHNFLLLHINTFTSTRIEGIQGYTKYTLLKFC